MKEIKNIIIFLIILIVVTPSKIPENDYQQCVIIFHLSI